MRVYGVFFVLTLVALQQFAVVLAQTNSNFDAYACESLANEYNDAAVCASDCTFKVVCKYYPLLIEAYADDGICCYNPSLNDCKGTQESLRYGLDAIQQS